MTDVRGEDVVLAAESMPTYGPAWRDLLDATMSIGGSRPGLELTNEDLASLSCPVAFAWRAADPMVPASTGRAVARAIPGARFTITGAGHLQWVDDAAVARAIEPVLAPVVRRQLSAEPR